MVFHNEIYDVLNKLEGRKFTINIMKNFNCDKTSLNLTCDEAKLFKYLLKMIMKKHTKDKYILTKDNKNYLKKDIVLQYLNDFGNKFNNFRKHYYDIMKKQNASIQTVPTINTPIMQADMISGQDDAIVIMLIFMLFSGLVSLISDTRKQNLIKKYAIYIQQYFTIIQQNITPIIIKLTEKINIISDIKISTICVNGKPLNDTKPFANDKTKIIKCKTSDYEQVKDSKQKKVLKLFFEHLEKSKN